MIANVEYVFDAATHQYSLAGRNVPATSNVLQSGGLVPHFDFVSEELLERRSELGREVHWACHLHNLHKLGSYDPRIKPHLHAWMAFKEKCKSFQLIASEYQTVAFADGMPYGMQLDCNALVNGTDTIIELKIGKPLPHHGLQLAAYAAGAPHGKWNTPIARFMARKRIVVELRANGNPKVHEFDERSDYQDFCSLLRIANWKRRYDHVYREEKS